jgi:hypothetical protein
MHITVFHLKGIFLFGAVLLFCVGGCLPVVVHAEGSYVNVALASANNQLVACYDAAKAAEAAGANITALTSALNIAGALLSNAQYAFSTGDFVSAQNFAIQCQNQLGGLVQEANSLQISASQGRSTDFFVNFLGSIAGAIMVIVGSIIVWVLLKRRKVNGGAN